MRPSQVAKMGCAFFYKLESATSPINRKTPRLGSSRPLGNSMRGVALFNCCGMSNLGNSPQASARLTIITSRRSGTSPSNVPARILTLTYFLAAPPMTG